MRYSQSESHVHAAPEPPPPAIVNGRTSRTASNVGINNQTVQREGGLVVFFFALPVLERTRERERERTKEREGGSEAYLSFISGFSKGTFPPGIILL